MIAFPTRLMDVASNCQSQKASCFQYTKSCFKIQIFLSKEEGLSVFAETQHVIFFLKTFQIKMEFLNPESVKLFLSSL